MPDPGPVVSLGTPTSRVVVAELVRELCTVLQRAGVEHAPREARDIVAAVVDEPRFWASLHAQEAVDTATAQAARDAADQRARGAPFAYAVGRAAFRYLTLMVDSRVLIPRQETEVLVDLVLARSQTGVAIDIGTGSGAIALALASEGRFERILATDVSRGALAVARENAQRLGSALRAPVEFRLGSLLAPVLGERAAVVVANPPYIAYDEAATLPRSVRDWEPPLALLAGQSGMAAIADIIRASAQVLVQGGLLALELDARRASLAAELALTDARYTTVHIARDLAGRERFLLATRR